MNAAGDDSLYVVFAADANYAMPLAVALCSAAKNCSSARMIAFYILESGFTDALKKRVERSLSIVRSDAVSIHWKTVSAKDLAGYKLAHGYTSAMTFARLLIPDLLPIEATKAIYLDSDVVVLGDLCQLWDQHIGSHAILAARDTTATVSEPTGIANYEELGIPADNHYFNAGVLVLNITRWRELNLAAHLFNYLDHYRNIIQLADQEALNAVLWNDWRELDYAWNWQIEWRDYRLGRAMPSWNPPASPRHIVHFITAEKPWRPGCDYPEKRFFYDYLQETDWAGWRLSALDEISGRTRRSLLEVRKRIGIWRRRYFPRHGNLGRRGML
jgi:lipopolysaccharide biosynthesis glycosyltransferase